MRASRLLQVLVVLAFLSVSPSWAGPVTGQPVTTPANPPADEAPPQVDQPRVLAAFDASTLFDSSGLPLLRLSAPTYLQLDGRPKLKDLNPPKIEPIVVKDEPSNNNDNNSSDNSSQLLPPPASVVADLGNVNATVPTNFSNVPGSVTQIPEPAALLLLAPAMLIALRRRHTRSQGR